MVDTLDPRFLGPVIEQEQDDDGRSTVYASTDNGWTNDGQSDAGNPPAPAPPTFPQSDSTKLIDFDDSEGGQAAVADNNSIQTSPDVIEQGFAKEVATISSSGNTPPIKPFQSGRKVLDPSSAEFTPSSSAPDDLPSIHSVSSYCDARQSQEPRYDLVTTLKSRLKQLEIDHETLKRENDNLDMVNETLKHQSNLDESTITKLKDRITEAELLRRRAQTYSVELNERCKQGQGALSQLQEEFEHSQIQLEEYKNKYAGAVASNGPLHSQMQGMQNCLLNAVERAKMYEAFMRNFLADHPEFTAAFAIIGVSPDGVGNMNASTPTPPDDEPLISFEDSSPTLSKPQSIRPNFSAEDRQPSSLSPPLDNRSIETADSQHTQVHKATGLDWSEDSDNIWDSPCQREIALQIHQQVIGSRHPLKVPGMLKYGLRYIRIETGQKLTANYGVPDVASRTVIMTGLPDDVHVQRVLEHIRGGRILKAQTAPMGTGDNRFNHAYIEFISPEDAIAFYRCSLNREFGFATASDSSVRVRISIPTTDSFPLNTSILTMIREGSTRCLSVTGFPVMHLHAVLNKAGLAYTFAEIITHFVYSDDGSFQISFSNIESAVLVRKCIIGSPLYTGSPDGREVAFCPDPCEASLESLPQVAFLPTDASFNVDILSAENARDFQTKDNAGAEDQRYQEERLANAHSDDPEEKADIEALRERQKPIVWEKGANWDEAIEYMALDPDQGKEVRHRRDPESGAFQMMYYGGWAYTTEQSQKEWLHYNIDSPNAYTQKTADLIYASTGWIDQRKIVVDDGGIFGDADQSLNQTSDEPREELVAHRPASSRPSLSELIDMGSSVICMNPSVRVPAGAHHNHIESNSGLRFPSLLDQSNTDNNVSTPPLAFNQRPLTNQTALSSAAQSAMSECFDGTLHGITKAGFNELAARIAQDKREPNKKKPSNDQGPF
ncbi:hypothetical protein CORC01_08434 [Colletotrichum orchidophilum]|uniref:RRM domain-containing protein n=1 Tax=Colletotrichum orchidophilum TaxID=1209926 RepID=A0A1G4B4D5_9PEZI|nr:uncharacterized protein CORC01_08434 [Colletotrichum orchidophilum]OHE96216.1 hypothetical protein CORC01_08434 [Colletotrichum orchidophilum]